MYFGLNGGSGGSGGCGGVFQKTFLVRDKGGVFRGGWWCFGLVGGGIFNLGGDFAVVVKVEVEDFELVVKIFVRLVWDCSNGGMYIFWVLSLMSVEGKMSNIDEHLFEMVMWAGFLRLLLFLDGDG